MGLFSGLGKLAGGLFGGVGEIVGGIIGGAKDDQNAREGVQETNEANAYQAQLNRDFQKEQRATQWQTSVADLQAAGLNPMLAYSQGPAGNNPGATAAPMQNKQQAVLATNAANAQIQNVEADTLNKIRSADLITAQTEATRAQAENTGAQTENIKMTLPKIQEEIKDVMNSAELKRQQALSETDRRNLMEAQRKLAQVQQALASEQISNVEAQTATQKILTQHRILELPELKNKAWLEESMNGVQQAGGMAGRGATALGQVVNSARKVLGK